MERGAHFYNSSLRSETKMAKIIHKKAECISCGSCVSLCPKYFEIAEDGRAHLKGSEEDTKTEEETLEVSDPGCAKEAVEVCPVQCIRIE